MVVAGTGTGGTMTGIARKIKEVCPNCQVRRNPPHSCPGFPSSAFSCSCTHSSSNFLYLSTPTVYFSSLSLSLLLFFAPLGLSSTSPGRSLYFKSTSHVLHFLLSRIGCYPFNQLLTPLQIVAADPYGSILAQPEALNEMDVTG